MYTPVLLNIFRKRFKEGVNRIAFTLDDIREELLACGVAARNAPDLVYRMKSRTKLPDEIQDKGFRILEITNRGEYALVKGESTLIDYPVADGITEIEDETPTAVRKMMPEHFGHIDEQGFLSVLRYNGLFSRFLEVPAFHLKSHVRKSVPGVGQAELDDVYVAVPKAGDDNGLLTIVPVEAKAKDDPVNRTQITMQVRYAHDAFPGHPVRPLTVKLFEDGLILFMEFNAVIDPTALKITRHAHYRLRRT